MMMLLSSSSSSSSWSSSSSSHIKRLSETLRRITFAFPEGQKKEREDIGEGGVGGGGDEKRLRHWWNVEPSSKSASYFILSCFEDRYPEGPTYHQYGIRCGIKLP
ncbi:unnamed protein product [Enterobius vermicularis]|uniref:UBC core domain-containing protein n=1 Tax=Enterobius vermicularis TaxID=51028 RepID=A0A0N4VP64_ENTVE|nr:unnamed protein product [Enterobius vermicularis]